MRHHDHRHALIGERTHHIEHLTHEFGVERARRLVEQHDLGFHRKRARNGDALLLAARKLARIVVHAVAEPHALEFGDGEFARLGLGHMLDVHRRFHHVFEHGHVREEVEFLEHHAELGALLRDLLLVEPLQCAVRKALVADHLAVHIDLAAGERLQLVDQAQECGFARARRPQDHGDGARFHFEVDALEHMQVAEGLVHVFRLHNRLRGLRPGGCGVRCL